MTEIELLENLPVSGLFVKYAAWIPKLTEEEKDKISKYYRQLCTRALEERIIGKTDPENIWLRHILDSLLPLQQEKIRHTFESSASVSDLGSGAGLPGILYSILYPGKQFVLIEMAVKRVHFLEDMISLLGLKNVKVWHGPVEKFSSRTDIVMYRAFRKPLASLEMALGVLKPGGRVLYWRANRFDHSGSQGTATGVNSLQGKVRERIKSLGFLSTDFFELECPGELDHRGIYMFHLTGVPGKGFPRKWSVIHEDNLVNEVV